MTSIRRMAGYWICGLMLVVCPVLLHGQDNPPKKKTETRGNAPATQQHTQHTPPAEHKEAAPRTQNATPREPVHTAPPQTQQPATGQQGRTFGNRPATTNPQQQAPNRPVQNDSSGRTFGNHPANTNPQPTPRTNPPNQPGRTFGNQQGTQSTPGTVRGGFGGGNDRPAHTMDAARPPAGRTVIRTQGGDVIHRSPGGQVREVHMSSGAVVYHPPSGPRRVEVVRPGGRVVVASAPGHGYVQRPIVVRNVTVIKRTYVYNGVPVARIYRPRVYNGITLAVYTPVHYYRPAFYVWAYNPWPQPVVYTWGWRRARWYGYYGGYFTPYPVYASPSLWLTDYLIAATFEAAYQERMAANAAAANSYYASAPQSAPMTPEVKQAIADEVRRQIDAQRMEQSSMGNGGPQTTIFNDNTPHVFVANASYAYNSNAGECTISEGDVIQMNGAPPANATMADLVVLSSRGQDCRKGSMLSVPLQDLQEMHNAMMATVDRGMGEMQSKQGQNGIPAPPSGSVGTIDSPFAAEAQPDAGADGDLRGAIQETERAEQQAISQTSANPPTLTLGMSLDEVTKIQGSPEKIVDLGAKKMYVYKDLKITFTDGKVTDIQ